MNDDVYHNGAFMLAHRFPFYMGFHEREGEFETPQPAVPFQYGTPDVYDFCLTMGSLANADEKYCRHKATLYFRQRLRRVPQEKSPAENPD